MINHLYWSAVSTPDGNGDLIKAKWMSVVNHVHNKGKFFQSANIRNWEGEQEKLNGLNRVSY